MKNNNENKYSDTRNYMSISEFPLVVCLICLDFKVEDQNNDLKNSGRIEFLFKKTEKLNRAISDYWNGDLLIDPKKFWSISRELKSRIRSIK